MSPIREKFVNVIESLPYNIDEEVLKKSTKEILQEVTQKLLILYGVDDLSENDKRMYKVINWKYNLIKERIVIIMSIKEDIPYGKN